LIGFAMLVMKLEHRVGVVIGILPLLSVFVWKSYRLDYPYVQLEGVLKKPPLSTTAAISPTWREFKEPDLREKLVCSHIALEQDEMTAVLARTFPCKLVAFNNGTFNRATIADLLIPSAKHASFSIDQEFVMNVFASCFIVTTTILLIWPRHSNGIQS